MSTIVIDDRGLATLEIADASGEVFHYSLEPALPGCSDWAVWVERLQPESEPGRYRVSLEAGDWWRCTCPSFRYRKSSLGDRGCKHTREIKSLYRFIVSILEKPHEHNDSQPQRDNVSISRGDRPAPARALPA